MEYSKYQLKFFEAIGDLFKAGNKIKYIVLAAVAGSGKTFSIVHSLKHIPFGKKIKLFAFNKSIANELAQKVPETVDTSTVHSFGCKAIFAYMRGKVSVQEKKSWGFIEKFMVEEGRQWESRREKVNFIFDMMKLINMWRINLMDDDTRPTHKKVLSLMLKYDVDLKNKEDFLNYFGPIWNSIKTYNKKYLNGEGNEEKMMIDFVDMIYLPVEYEQIPVKKFDIIFVDECQDLSMCQQLFCERAIKHNGFGVWVGDKNQAIYGFAGANHQSYEMLVSKPNTRELELSVCYRCCKEVVSLAQKIVPQIKPFEGQIEGKVVRKEKSVMSAEEGDMILCRNVKPLVSLWFEFVSQGKKCFVKGKEIGQELVKMVDSVRHLPREQAIEKLYEEKKKLLECLVAEGMEKPESHPKYVKANEYTAVIQKVSENCDTMVQVADTLTRIFEDKESGVQLMTIHKSKGLENKKVYIIKPDLVPSKYAVTEEQLQQEGNLLYVAYTRAMEELIIDQKWTEPS